MSKRIYLVQDAENLDGARRLVKATSPSQAVRHCAKRYTAEVATQEQLVDLVTSGAKVEEAGNDE